MYLTIDAGNSNVDICRFDGEKLLVDSYSVPTSSLLPLKTLLEPMAKTTKKVIISSVVPNINDSLAELIKLHLEVEPIFLSYQTPTRVEFNRAFGAGLGMDFVANANGTGVFFPNRDCVLVAFGTATTISIIKENMLNIIAIMPGLRTSIKALFDNTAMVEVGDIGVISSLGVNNRSPRLVENGIYLSHLGGIKEIITMAVAEFSLSDYEVIATGGGASLFKDTGIFSLIEKNLAHIGLMDILKFNGLE